MPKTKYIPALRFHWLTNAYDKLLALTFPEKGVKCDLLSEANIQIGETVLDFGIGTATLSIMAHKQQPGAIYFGVDVDAYILNLAEKKIADTEAPISPMLYDGITLPFPDASFDTVISCLVFHHLSTEAKQTALIEINRVLKTGGKLIIVDFGKPRTLYTKIAFFLFSFFDGRENTRVNGQGLLPLFLEDAHFQPISLIRNYNIVFGTVQLLSTIKA